MQLQLRRLLLLCTHLDGALGGALGSGVVAEQGAVLLRGGFWDWVARERSSLTASVDCALLLCLRRLLIVNKHQH